MPTPSRLPERPSLEPKINSEPVVMALYCEALTMFCLLRICPGSFCCVRELSEHQANGSQVQEGESLAAEALPVFGQPTAAVQPSYGAFDNPALRQDREALGLIGPLDDLHTDAAADASQTSSMS